MKLSSAFALLSLVVLSAHALPPQAKRADAIDDTAVLNFALTLEHLENAFYGEGLAKYDDKAFADAGYAPFVRGRFTQIAQHEKSHVAFLSQALGDKATQPCQYNFPHNDPKSFVALSQALEGVGVTAYTGAAGLITNKDYLTAAASVLATEARHASWVASAVNKFSGWSGDFDVPLTPNEVFTMAGAFITSCPSTNPALPVKAFPTLSVSSGKAQPGSPIAFQFNSTAIAQGTKLYAVFFTGLSKIFVPLEDQIVVPKELLGTVYVVVSKNGTVADDSNVVAGPAMLQFEFDSHGQVIA